MKTTTTTTTTTTSTACVLALAAAALSLAAPVPTAAEGPQTQAARSTAAVFGEGWESFGAPLEKRRARAYRPIEGVVARAERLDGRKVHVEGVVREVCRKSGCWMILGDSEQPVRVTFADYAFFVPKDAAGRPARLDGTFRVVETPLEEARHYLEDAGRHEEAAALEGPQRDHTIVATGVELGPRPADDD